jgi:hypothetical protein
MMPNYMFVWTRLWVLGMFLFSWPSAQAVQIEQITDPAMINRVAVHEGECLWTLNVSTAVSVESGVYARIDLNGQTLIPFARTLGMSRNSRSRTNASTHQIVETANAEVSLIIPTSAREQAKKIMSAPKTLVEVREVPAPAQPPTGPTVISKEQLLRSADPSVRALVDDNGAALKRGIIVGEPNCFQ